MCLFSLLQPFGQLDTGNTRKYGGTGLGLSLSRRFCEKMGGTVSLAHSEEGKGSTFEFSLVLDKLRDDTLYLLLYSFIYLINLSLLLSLLFYGRQQLGAEVGRAIHETVSDSPEFTPLLATPSSTSSSQSQTISPLSLSHSISLSQSQQVTSPSSATSPAALPTSSSSKHLPTSPSSSVSSFLSPSPFVGLFNSSSSSVSSPPLVSAHNDVWVALVLEHNKFTAQSLLHYLKILSFHPDLSFAFDTPEELLKYLAGASTRAMRRRTATHRTAAYAGARRRVCVFAHTHTQHRAELERAWQDAALADRVHAWVWITPPHGNTGFANNNAGSQETQVNATMRVATLTKPIFFSDLVRCLMKTFQLSANQLGLWYTYFPDNLHASMSHGGSSAELRFNREYLYY